MLICNKKNSMYTALKNAIHHADEILINVSFIRDSGLKLLIPELLNAKSAGKSIKILTSDYMNVTEPNALYRLLPFDGVRLFDNKNNQSFHPKTYIFKKNNQVEIYIGSSNISYSALISGVEWNYSFQGTDDHHDVTEILSEFESLYENNSFNLTLEWLRNYEKSYKKSDFDKIIDPISAPTIEVKKEPIKFQIPALYELSKTREEGYKKALVVVGTGLGKTYLSAFDSMHFEKILFVAHRDEILKDAKKTFEAIYGETKTYGFFNGYEKELGKEITFASVATLSKDSYLMEEYFSREAFDYIVIDEFHHGSAQSYQKILNYFKPKFLLGLTATPERTDSGDIYKLCDYNIAYECNFKVGIDNGWLTPFEYFGIYDETDYSTIPWRNGKYQLEALENSLIVAKRVELIYKKYMAYKKKHAIAFCASIKQCEIMHAFFLSKNIQSEIIVGSTPIKKRQESIERLKNGSLEIIFTVDVFNEGVDIPCLDLLLFLRPTTSYTIFIQQLGRGLRTFTGKEILRVLDFVGNYKGAELKPLFLTGNYKKGERSLSSLDENFILPSGCSANFDLKLIEYFEEAKKQRDSLASKLSADFFNVKALIGKTPNIMAIYTFGEIPVHSYLQKYKSWYLFLKQINELSQEEARFSDVALSFLTFLEKTAMTKSYKIPLFLSLFDDEVKQSLSLNAIGHFFQSFYQEPLHKKDLNNKKHQTLHEWDLNQFKRLAKENPIYFLTKENKYNQFFSFEEDHFSLNNALFEEIKENNALLEAILDRLTYRKVNYFRRKYMED